MAYLGRYTEAKKAYEDGLIHDPNNEQLKSGLEDVKARSTASSSARRNPSMYIKLCVFLCIKVLEAIFIDVIFEYVPVLLFVMPWFTSVLVS